jgi:hypothetical protein
VGFCEAQFLRHSETPPALPPPTTLHELNARIREAFTKTDHEILHKRGRWLNIVLKLLEAWRRSY